MKKILLLIAILFSCNNNPYWIDQNVRFERMKGPAWENNVALFRVRSTLKTGVDWAITHEHASVDKVVAEYLIEKEKTKQYAELMEIQKGIETAERYNKK